MRHTHTHTIDFRRFWFASMNGDKGIRFAMNHIIELMRTIEKEQSRARYFAGR